MSSTEVEIIDANGQVRQGVSVGAPNATTGQVLTADGAGAAAWNDPGGGAAGSPNATLLVSGAQGQTASFAALITGGGMQDGTIHGTVNGLTVAAPTGPVANLEQVSFVLAGTVASTADDFDVEVSVYVTDTLGTNVASCSGGFSVASPVTDLTLSESLSGADWNIISGTDLTANGDELDSTAGGGYFALVTVDGSWD